MQQISIGVRNGCFCAHPYILHLLGLTPEQTARVRDEIDLPIAAYNVSGEYARLKAAAANKWIDHDRAVLETLTSIRRAGADIVITYYAREAARALA